MSAGRRSGSRRLRATPRAAGASTGAAAAAAALLEAFAAADAAQLAVDSSYAPVSALPRSRIFFSAGAIDFSEPPAELCFSSLSFR